MARTFIHVTVVICSLTWQAFVFYTFRLFPPVWYLKAYFDDKLQAFIKSVKTLAFNVRALITYSCNKFYSAGPVCQSFHVMGNYSYSLKCIYIVVVHGIADGKRTLELSTKGYLHCLLGQLDKN